MTVGIMGVAPTIFSYPHTLHLGIIVEYMTQFTNASRKHIYVFIKNFYINSVKWVRFDTENTGWGSAWWEYTLNPWRERNQKFVLALFAASG